MPMPPHQPINPSTAFACMKGHHVAMRVPDFEASKSWFIEKLGFRVLKQWSSKELELAYLAPATDDTFHIEIMGGASPKPKRGYADLEDSLCDAGYHHFCLTVDDIDKTVAELRRLEVRIVKEPFHVTAINRRLAFFADPWDNLIELSQFIP
jgi:glyoxylase I family protein